MTPDSPTLGPRIGEVCARFEKAWRTSPPPLIEDYAAGWTGDERAALLRELALLDLQYRRGGGEQVTPLDDAQRLSGATFDGGTVAYSPAGDDASLPPAPGFSEAATLERGPGAPPPTGTPSPRMLPPGYEYLGELGRGGMGVVYKARHVVLNRPCALKMILSGAHSSPAEVERFKIEARAVARLNHPGIVQVYEVGQYEGRPFMALEYCPGGSLDAKLARNPLPAREAAELVRALAEAVQAAHAANLVHRDLKPGNVLLDGQARPKITDFGLAKRLDEQGATRTGSVVGTPSYMPPEQAAGKKDVGTAADVYALGAILYECLAGRPPFRAATAMDTLLQVLADEPAPLRQLNATVPRDLETVVHRCLQKDPARRYASAQALADDLGRFLAGEPVLARPVGWVARAWRWCRRKPLAAAMVALVGLVLAAAVVVPIAVASAINAERNKTQAALDESLTNERKAQEAEKNALRQAAESTVERALQMCHRGEVAPGLLWLTRGLALSRQVGDADLEDACRWNLGAWSREVHSLERSLPHPQAVLCVAFSRDGKTIASGCADGRVRFWDVATGGETGAPLAQPSGVAALAFQPGGTKVATADLDGLLRIWEPGREKPLREWRYQPERSHDSLRCRIAFSPDGTRLVTGGMGATLNVWDVATGERARPAIRLSDNGGTFAEGVDWSLDGRHLLAATGGSWTATVFDATTGQVVGTHIRTPSRCTVGMFRPDGQVFATGGLHDGSVLLWEIGTGKSVARLPHQAPLTGIDFSPDGALLASCTEEGDATLWDMRNHQPVGARLVHPHHTHGIAFAPDGGSVATAGSDGQLRLWRVAPRAERARIPQVAQVMSLAFTPDSRELLVGLHGDQNPRGGGTVIRRYDRRTGRLGTVRYDGAPDTNQMVWGGMLITPDGKDLFVCTHSQIVRWDARTGQRRDVLRGDSNPPFVSDAKLSRDGAWLVVGFEPDWNAERPSEALLYDLRQTPPRPVRLSPPRGAPRPYNLAAFPDGGRVAIDSANRRLWLASFDGQIHTLDPATGEASAPPATPLSGEDCPVALTLRPDDRVLLTGGTGRVVRQWDPVTWKECGPSLPHAGTIRRVLYTPDGRLIATSGFDGAGRLWHPATGKLVGPLLAHGDRLDGLAVSPDGQTLATGSYQGRDARIWSIPAPAVLPPEEMLAWVERLTGQTMDAAGVVRQLSPEEWAWRRRGYSRPVPERTRTELEQHLRGHPADLDSVADLAGSLLKNRPPAGWTVLEPTSAESASGATLTRLNDGSILASGACPDADCYTVAVRNPVRGVTALRLEALADPTMPNRGPGRNPGPNGGNFCLSEITLLATRPGDPRPSLPVSLVTAAGHRRPSDQHTTELDGPHGAIDGRPGTYWDVYHRIGRDSAAIFQTAAPCEAAALLVRLDFQSRWKQHSLGRFRLSATSRPNAARDENLAALAARANPWARLGTAYFLHGDEAAARRAFAAAETGLSARDRFLRAFVLEQVGRPVADPEFALGLAAVAAEPAEHLHLAADLLSARVARDAKASWLLARRQINQRLGRTSAAFADFERALDLDCTCPLGRTEAAAHLWAARYWMGLLRPERAARHALAAALLDPDTARTPLVGHAFPSGPGRWKIDGAEVVQEARLDAGCWLRFGDPAWTDYDLELEALRVDGIDGFAVGFRMADEGNFANANFGGWGNQGHGVEVTVAGVPKGVFQPTQPGPVAAGQWYRVKVEVRGPAVRGFLDGAQVAEMADLPHPRGMVGVRSWGTENRFRNFKITAPDGLVLFAGVPRIHALPDGEVWPPLP